MSNFDDVHAEAEHDHFNERFEADEADRLDARDDLGSWRAARSNFEADPADFIHGHGAADSTVSPARSDLPF